MKRSGTVKEAVADVLTRMRDEDVDVNGCFVRRSSDTASARPHHFRAQPRVAARSCAPILASKVLPSFRNQHRTHPSEPDTYKQLTVSIEVLTLASD